MGKLFAVEVIYRGVFQKTLAKNITRGVVLAAHNEGKLGLSFGRYGDSPERNGIPAKSFAIVANDEQTLEAGMAQYEPKQVDLTVVLDDTLTKGGESWAWYGLQPVHHALKAGSPLIVVSLRDAPALLKNIHRREEPYKLGILKGVTNFSGMWVYKDDHTDVRVLGAIAKALPELVSLKAVEQFITEKLKNDLKVTSAQTAYQRFKTIDVKPGQGNPDALPKFELLKWEDMREGVSIKGQPQGGPITDPVTKQKGGFRPARNELFKKIFDAHAAAGREFLDLHQVHGVLVELPRCFLRCNPGQDLRREPRSVLRMRHLRGRLPREGLHHHGQRVAVPRQQEPVGGVQERSGRLPEVAGKDGQVGRAGTEAGSWFPLSRPIQGTGPRGPGSCSERLIRPGADQDLRRIRWRH